MAKKHHDFVDSYKYLLETKKYSERNARHALARRIATITYGVMKGDIKYDTFKRRKNIEKRQENTKKITCNLS